MARPTMHAGEHLGAAPIAREAVSAKAALWDVLDCGGRCVAILLFLLTLPVTIAAAVAIRALSGRTPFIAHKRVGWKGDVLWLLKLRTMWSDSTARVHGGLWIEYIQDEDGPGKKEFRDARVRHGFARFCRRHSLDELPQLWHVIRGEMALVGPRPATERELRVYYGESREEVLSVKPGIAGLWQVCGRSRLSYEERVRLDLYFVRGRTFGMYFRICVRAAWEVWSGANAW